MSAPELVITQESLETLTEIIAQAMAAAGLDRDADPNLLPQRIEELRFAGSLHIAGDYPRHEAKRERAPNLNAHGREFAEPSTLGRKHRTGPTYGRALTAAAAPL